MTSLNAFWHTTPGNILYFALFLIITAIILFGCFKLMKFVFDRFEKTPDFLLFVVNAIALFGAMAMTLFVLPPLIGRHGKIDTIYLFEDGTKRSATVLLKTPAGSRSRRGPPHIEGIHMMLAPSREVLVRDRIIKSAKSWHVIDGQFIVAHNAKKSTLVDLRSMKHLADVEDVIQGRVHGKTYRIERRSPQALTVRTQDNQVHTFTFSELIKTPPTTSRATRRVKPRESCELTTRTKPHYKVLNKTWFRVVKLKECGVHGTLFLHRDTAFGPGALFLSWEGSNDQKSAQKPSKWTINLTDIFGESPNLRLFPIKQIKDQIRLIAMIGEYGAIELNINAKTGAITSKIMIL